MKKRNRTVRKINDRVARKPIEMKVTGYEVVEKQAEIGGTSGRIYVPRSWVGKLVRAIRVER
jgi:hypothetical protein